MKLYIIRKYIMAKDARDAIRKDKDAKVDDVWLDEEWKRNNLSIHKQKEPFGFKKIKSNKQKL